jgi:hypothetical protein
MGQWLSEPVRLAARCRPLPSRSTRPTTLVPGLSRCGGNATRKLTATEPGGLRWGTVGVRSRSRPRVRSGRGSFCPQHAPRTSRDSTRVVSGMSLPAPSSSSARSPCEVAREVAREGRREARSWHVAYDCEVRGRRDGALGLPPTAARTGRRAVRLLPERAQEIAAGHRAVRRDLLAAGVHDGGQLANEPGETHRRNGNKTGRRTAGRKER